MLIRLFRPLAALSLACLTPIAECQLQQSCQTRAVASQTPTWTTTLTFPRFDPSRGQLTQVRIKLTSNATGSSRVESQGSTPVQATSTFGVDATLSRPNNTTITTTSARAQYIDSFSAFDGLMDFAGTSGVTHSNIQTSAATSVTLSSPSDLALFTGPAGLPGTISLSASAVNVSTATGGGSLITQFSASAGVDAEVCFDFVSRFTDAISREVSAAVGLSPLPVFDDAVSREVSVSVGLVPSVVFTDAISREISVTAGLNLPPVFIDAISREVSVSTPFPDLAITQLSTPAAGDSNTTFKLSLTVTNVGSGPAQTSWTEQVFRSPNAVFGDGDDVAATAAFPVGPPQALAHGASFTHDILSVPYGSTFGTFYFAVRVVGGAGYGDEDTSDNVRFTGLVTVLNAAIPKPDLTCEIVQIPPPGAASVFSGGTFPLTYRVRNIGTAPTNVATWVDRIYVLDSTTAALTDAALRKSIPNASFLSNSPTTPFFYEVTTEVPLPEDFSGARYVAVVTDAAAQMTESNEGNNVASSAAFQVDLGPQPDLVVQPQSVHVDTGAGSIAFGGQLVTVQWSDVNLGAPTDSGHWTDRVYLSSDGQPSISASDISLGTLAVSRTSPLLSSDPPLARTASFALPREMQGIYFVKVLVDSNFTASSSGDVTEAGGNRELNNVTASQAAIDVRFGQTPNLEALAVRFVGSDPVLAGHTRLVEWEVREEVHAAWHTGFSWVDRIYLSQDPILSSSSPADILLGAFPQSATPIGALGGGCWSGTNYWDDPSVTHDPWNYGPKTATVTIPQNLPAGDWYLILSVDADNSVYERNAALSPNFEADNIVVSSTSTTTPVPAPVPVAVQATDLVITPGVLSVADLTAPAGQPIPLSFTVRNQGAAVTPVSTWLDRVYLSNDTTLSPNDPVMLTVVHSGVLQAGATYVVDAIGTVPLATPQTYYLIFVTDDADPGFPTGRVWELGGEGNNVAVAQVGQSQTPAPFVVTAQAADLIVADPILVPSMSSTGQSLPVTWTVTNVGSLATVATSWTDRVYLSSDTSIHAGDILLGAFTRGGSLAAGDSYSQTAAFTIPLGLSGGIYYVIVETDALGNVFESNNSNNSRFRDTGLNVAMSPPANLVVSAGPTFGAFPLAPPVYPLSGQPLPLSWTIQNTGQGMTSVSHWNDVVYLSLDPYLDPSIDTYLGTYEHTSSLGSPSLPGSVSSRSVQTSFVVPLGVSGPRYVLVHTDALNEVFEGSQESDNVAASTLTTINLPTPCDLRVTDLQFPATGRLGFRFPVTWTTANEGGSKASGSWTDNFYLSSDDQFDGQDRLLGQVINTAGSLVPGGLHTQTQIFTIPGVLPATYHVLVLSDARDQIPELDESDNDQSSTTITALSAIDIAPGGVSIQSTPNNAERYFKLSVPPGPPRTLRVTFTHDSPNAWTELYASADTIPRPGDSDFAFTTPGAREQRLTIPDASGQTFYILARATSGVGQMTQNAVLSVQELPFAVDAITPQRAGQGLVTLSLEGSRLDSLTDLYLEPSGASTPARVAAMETRIVDPLHVLALFDLSAQPAGAFDLVVQGDVGSPPIVLVSALTVEPAQPLIAAASLDFAPSIKKGARGNARLRVENRGNVNLTHAFVVVAKRADARAPIELPGVNGGALESDGQRESLVLHVRELGPSQRAEIELETTIDSMYAENTLVVALSGAVFDDASWVASRLPSFAETLRIAVLADPASTAALRARAATPNGWLAAIVTHLAVPSSILFDPGAAPELGREFVTTLASAATNGLAATDQVSAALVARVTAALACDALTGNAPFDCSALQPITCGDGTASTVVTIAQGANTPVELVCCATPTSDDPNEKTHPKGHGAQQQLSSRAAVPYRIYFENVSTAAAPASLVQIEDEFEPTLKASSFRATRIVFGDNEIDLGPGGLLTCQRTVPLPDSPGLELQITSGVDAATNKAFWRLESVDADSGLPITDGVRGFLPPNDEHGNGAGHVEFLVNPNPTVVVTGTTASNSATVLFDSNAPIHTNRVLNTFDADSPLSGLTAAPVPAAPFDIRLQWSGSDPIGGAGLKDFTVYAARDDEPYAPILTDVATNAFVFHARPGSTYRFYSRGRDNTGNLEIAPVTPDATFVVPADCNGNGIPDAADVAAQTSPDCDSNLVPDECDPDSDGDHTIDACDGCPSDPAKTAPGVCGCGVAESASDSDGDGVVDCIDNCIAIANPTQSDCDADFVGDACEVAAGARDCNSNLVPDDCDIANATSVDANANAAPDECEGGPGSAFCAGDGVDPLVTTSCPCGNNGAAGNGCANSIEAGGASLAATGTTSPETIVLAADRMPQFALAIYTKSNVWSPTGVVSGDGVLCLGGSIVRMATKRNVGGSSVYPEAGDAALSQRSFTIPGSGATAYYQTYYRNAAATYCTAATINLTNAWQVVW